MNTRVLIKVYVLNTDRKNDFIDHRKFVSKFNN